MMLRLLLRKLILSSGDIWLVMVEEKETIHLSLIYLSAEVTELRKTDFKSLHLRRLADDLYAACLEPRAYGYGDLTMFRERLDTYLRDGREEDFSFMQAHTDYIC